MQDPGEAAHLGTGSVSKLLEPVVHYPALPGVVDGVGSRYSSVEEPPLGRPGFVEGHLDDGVHREDPGRGKGVGVVDGIRARESQLQWGIGGDDDVVCDCSH